MFEYTKVKHTLLANRRQENQNRIHRVIKVWIPHQHTNPREYHWDTIDCEYHLALYHHNVIIAYLFNFIIRVFRSSVQSTDNESNIIHNIMKCWGSIMIAIKNVYTDFTLPFLFGWIETLETNCLCSNTASLWW